jgi:hypothetical protein
MIENIDENNIEIALKKVKPGLEKYIKSNHLYAH